ncbi:MAG: hypothetical protein Q8L95_05975 [Burkholderiales bacterium]|nr:hypothetical protein [Burkholderiales bacterium]
MFIRKDYIGCLAVIGFVYVLFYGWLIVAGNGLPYVMDNNESFSSLWHAYNLFHFDLTKSAGLTDESFAFHVAAHPYVHTHQGNFPRLFALLIFSLGADSIESQIAVTTFTVGVAAIFMAYHFFSKIANPLFALVCCLLLITDYVLIAQWQVVTYRVWHMFFVFSSMLCVHRMIEGRRFWALATVVNFACLFYYELVFVAFVSLSSAFYAAFLCRHAPKKVLGFWVLQALGGIMALSVLALQLYLYLGWDGLKADLYLTFVARNQYQDDAALLRHMQEFFESRNIIFWYNLIDGSKFLTIRDFFASFLYFESQIHTPFLSTLCAVGLLTLFAVLRFRVHSSVSVPGPGVGLGNTRVLILTVPVAGALGLGVLHFLYIYHRNDLAPLHGAEFVAMAAAVVISAMVVEFAPRFHGADRLIALRNLSNRLALTMLVFNIPGISATLYYGWLAVVPRSNFFRGYVFIFCCFTIWVAWRMLLKEGPSRVVRHGGAWHRITSTSATVVSFLSFLGFFVMLFGKDLILGVPAEIQQWFLPVNFAYFSMALVAAGFATMLLHRVGQASFAVDRCLPGTNPIDSATTLRVSVFVVLVTLLIAGSWLLYNPLYVPLWQEIADVYLPGPLSQVVTILVVMLCSAAVVAKDEIFRKLGIIPGIKGCGAFFFAGICAYAVVYLLSPGYLFTGYRFRLVPFTAFHTITILGLSFYVLLVVGLKYLPSNCLRKTAVSSDALMAATPQEPRWMSMRAIVGVASLTTFGLLTVYWFGVQLSYIKLMPPNHYSFLQKLSKPPYAGKSFIANAYAAPIAAKTGTWAYLNVGLKSTGPVMDGDTYKFPFDTTYLWVADKKTNPDYAQPEYFLCVTMQAPSTVIKEVRRQKGLGDGNVGCELNQLVQLARRGDGKSVYPALELSEADEEGLSVVGYERWAIIKLNWKK